VIYNNILITGGAGMIGSHLIDELLLVNPDVKIFVLDNFSVGSSNNIPDTPNILSVDGSVLDKEVLDKLISQVEIVYHLATLKKGNDTDSSLDTLDTIVDSARNVLEACLEHSVRLVLASTSDVYGYGTTFPFTETSPVSLGPFNTRRWAYAVAKLYTEQLAYEFYRSGVDVRIIRFFGGFSERSSMTWRGGHIPLFTYNAFHDLDIVIHGDGSQTRCVTHGSDLAKGTLLAGLTENISGELFNIGSEEEITVKDAAERVLKHFPASKSKILYVETDEIFGTYSEIQRRRPSLEKSREILGYSPTVSFDDGISMLINKLENIND
jgi:UDP-glucose 4-epimerase